MRGVPSAAASVMNRYHPRSMAMVLVRIAIIGVILGELYVTAKIQLPNLMHPTAIGTDPSNYFAAGQRLNLGHNLYGPLLPGDRAVPGYPRTYPAPLLSPPLIAVIWRPLAALGQGAITVWWAANLLVVVALAGWFALVGSRRTLGGLMVILALGLAITLVLGVPYHLGFESPISIAALSGNLNGYLICLFVLCWWASSRNRAFITGAAAGLAAVLKLGPFALAWWLLVRRDWPALKAFAATVGVLGIVGLLGAGLDANIAFVHFALGGGVQPTSLSVPWMLERWFHLDQAQADPGTVVATIIGLTIVYLSRRNARFSFFVTILVVIYSSPVVLVGNFALLLAAVAPWAGSGQPAASPDSQPTTLSVEGRPGSASGELPAQPVNQAARA